ncbi:hypothetical protein L228DRAFT_261305 [Xylona heveae TC161]|uniref:Uncharacterized protein n=1 Tax=Xylona heveae (strain CBS 132557 / TC161) TaxID=1328760 RepID=A0A165GE38_XYLHT|nr:hypothetical protein L228DRAFT_261305 [Xylona heveae TC161]KZF22081.1 hypothetical protein L228DRAFT_261305 [Xylona heveae TC161]
MSRSLIDATEIPLCRESSTEPGKKEDWPALTPESSLSLDHAEDPRGNESFVSQDEMVNPTVNINNDGKKIIKDLPLQPMPKSSQAFHPADEDKGVILPLSVSDSVDGVEKMPAEEFSDSSTNDTSQFNQDSDIATSQYAQLANCNLNVSSAEAMESMQRPVTGRLRQKGSDKATQLLSIENRRVSIPDFRKTVMSLMAQNCSNPDESTESTMIEPDNLQTLTIFEEETLEDDKDDAKLNLCSPSSKVTTDSMQFSATSTKPASYTDPSHLYAHNARLKHVSATNPSLILRIAPEADRIIMGNSDLDKENVSKSNLRGSRFLPRTPSIQGIQNIVRNASTFDSRVKFPFGQKLRGASNLRTSWHNTGITKASRTAHVLLTYAFNRCVEMISPQKI